MSSPTKKSASPRSSRPPPSPLPPKRRRRPERKETGWQAENDGFPPMKSGLAMNFSLQREKELLSMPGSSPEKGILTNRSLPGSRGRFESASEMKCWADPFFKAGSYPRDDPRGKRRLPGQDDRPHAGSASQEDPVEVLADRITRWFVPAIFLIASGAGLYLWMVHPRSKRRSSGAHGPCHILPVRAGNSHADREGCGHGGRPPQGYPRSRPGALEQVKDLDTLVFDKTGN